jgi:prepilin-type N-terminal cleavage/methylation domain-containing protein
MNNNKQGGFSLIELLLVVVIIGVIATIGIPNFIRGISAAENGSANSTMKVILSTQTAFYSTNGRYARLDELNRLHQNSLGTVASNQLLRGKFIFEMIPANPTDAQLKDGFMIKATKPGGAGDLPYVVQITQGGFSTPIFP